MIRDVIKRSYVASMSRLHCCGVGCGVGCAVFFALPISLLSGGVAFAFWVF